MDTFYIRSGIPSLDAMLRPSLRREDEQGIALTGVAGMTSIAIAGPDGTGKSALAMHFVSRYLADCHQYCWNHEQRAEPLAFYVSTDLSHDMANVMWRNFRLDAPNERQVPFQYPQLGHPDHRPPSWLGGEAYFRKLRLVLNRHSPGDLDDLTNFLVQGDGETHHKSGVVKRGIAFVDLASDAAGDDWGFVERVIAVMPEPDLGENTPRHLLVIDAMEGMETFAGELDAFGQKTTRRGRVAKLIRAAGKKCHLIFIIEESKEGDRLAEQFVANVVLRLRATDEHGYSRRTIEIEKSRGQSHVRGRHPYVVRDGKGSTTGEQVNFDDPRVDYGKYSQSYLDVFPSLHSASRRIMESRDVGREQSPTRCAGFGIQELDEMLAKTSQLNDGFDGHDERGLPSGSVSALIGDANTQKSFLGLAYLGQTFQQLAWRLVQGARPRGVTRRGDSRLAHKFYFTHLAEVETRERRLKKKLSERTLSPEVRRWGQIIEKAGNGLVGAVVLITSKDENNRTLAKRFYEQLRKIDESGTRWDDPDFRIAFLAYLESRTICRRLEIHDTPSPVLFHTIRRSIEAARQITVSDYADVCQGSPLDDDASQRAKEGWRIRIVIDDFNTVTRTYGRIHDDHLFLPFLLLHLRREGLSSLIIETQSGAHGSPALPIGADAESADLRALSDYRLYTWHVPQFFGDHRIAIAAIPPMMKQDVKSPVRVRELEWYEPDSILPPTVNPRFELYTGLDTNEPKLVPLRVYLYSENEAWHDYIVRLDHTWHRVFDPPPAVIQQGHRTVVVPEKCENYDLMREVCDLHASTNLEYSLIVQVDEFWKHEHAFRPQVDYLKSSAEGAEDRRERRDCFDPVLYELPATKQNRPDRIPFVWDFGFLACKNQLWEEAATSGVPHLVKSDPELREKLTKIRDVWAALKVGSPCEWVDVLEAAFFVARWEAARQSRPIPAFDVAMAAPETFSCLVLEMWFSEICRKLERRDQTGKKASELVLKMEKRLWDVAPSDQLSLADLVREHTDELYRVWLLLVEALDLASFPARAEGFGFGFGRKVDPGAVVVRHWYKSAAVAHTEDDEGPMRFTRLPGRFSVRGDWFLASLRGSRSDRLVDHALDLLSTPAQNSERLMRGLGLPTRKLGADADKLSSRLRGRHFQSEEPETLTYAHVAALGAGHAKGALHWLWRSNIRDYYTAAPTWERWLFRMLRRWQRTREFFGSKWVDGFKLYRLFKVGRPASKFFIELPSYQTFTKMCGNLTNELEHIVDKPKPL